MADKKNNRNDKAFVLTLAAAVTSGLFGLIGFMSAGLASGAAAGIEGAMGFAIAGIGALSGLFVTYMAQAAAPEMKKAILGVFFGSALSAALVGGLLNNMHFKVREAHKNWDREFTNNHISIPITPEMKNLDRSALTYEAGKALRAFAENVNAEIAEKQAAEQKKREAAQQACLANKDAFAAAGINCNNLLAEPKAAL